jgi:aminomethyltransferase
MGELRVAGPGGGDGLAAALVSDPRRLRVGRAGYSMICAPDGGIIDDLIVYRIEDDAYLVVPNASNRSTVADELAQRLVGYRATLVDETMDTSLVALQGPRAASILAAGTDLDLDTLRNYGCARAVVAGVPALVARTGYTGEDGFELFVDWAQGPVIWDALLSAGHAEGLLPCGLGARDTLRLEAGMPLYGNELDLETSPYEAGLGWVVNLDREGDFVGRAGLEQRRAGPSTRRLVGLILRGRGIARHGYAVARAGGSRAQGIVTSGSQSPTLGEAIAMAYVPPADASPGTMLEVDIRGSAVPAEVVPLPFYRRAGR